MSKARTQTKANTAPTMRCAIYTRAGANPTNDNLIHGPYAKTMSRNPVFSSRCLSADAKIDSAAD